MNSIPFWLPDIDAFTEVKGRVSLDDEFLVLEIETALFGEFDSEEQVIKIEPAALESIHLEEGLIKDHLCLRPKKHDLLQAAPGQHGHELRLKVWRNHRERVSALIAQVHTRRRASHER